jgi:hypothetical protein
MQLLVSSDYALTTAVELDQMLRVMLKTGAATVAADGCIRRPFTDARNWYENNS